MEGLEKRNAKRIRRTKINQAVIATIGITGVLAVGLVAPNVLGALGKLGLLPRFRYQVKTVLSRMIAGGYVELEKRGGKSVVHLTEKGRRFALLAQEGKIAPKKKRWDGKWRIVMYDLKEPAKTLRARVREALKNFGFVMLQKSVWVCPYECEDLIFILKQEFRIGKNLLYVIADQIENDKGLRQHFSLPVA